MTFDLAALPVSVFALFAVFTRVGAFFMTAPALSDFQTPARIRLLAALAVSGALAPFAAPLAPPTDGAVVSAAGILMFEALAGASLGLVARIFMAALNVAGQIIAFQMGLSLAQIFDPSQELQGAIVGGFLAILGTTMIFATDLHLGLLLALKQSYLWLPPGGAFLAGDWSTLATATLGEAFALGLQLAAPFVLFGLVFYVGAGVLNRLMPQAQVFFMLMPANLMLGLMLLMLTTGLLMTIFLGRFETMLLSFGA